MDTIKTLLTNLIGNNTTYVDSNGILVPDYGFILAGILVIVFVYIFIKGIFALCKRH